MAIFKVYKQGQEFDILVDDEDVEWLSGYQWTMREGEYPATLIGRSYQGMHRLIMGAFLHEDVIIDHINGNPRDNRKSNLRRCNRFENQQNRKTNKGNTLPKGIQQMPNGNYRVRVQAFGKRYSLGAYPTLEEAVEARNKHAQEMHGEFFNPSYVLEENNDNRPTK